MPVTPPSPTVGSIISSAYNDSNQTKQQILELTPVGTVIEYISSIPIKPEGYAKTREESINKYMSVRYDMNTAINSYKDIVPNTYNDSASQLKIVPGIGGAIPVALQPGAPQDYIGYSMRFNGLQEGLSGPLTALTQTQANTSSWMVECMVKPMVTPSGFNQPIWSIGSADTSFSFALEINSSMQLVIHTNGATTVIPIITLALGDWNYISFRVSSGLIDINLNGNLLSSTVAAPTFLIGSNPVFYIGMSDYLGNRNSLNGYIEDIFLYNGVGEDRTNIQTASSSTKYSVSWRVLSSYVYKNPPNGWAVCDFTAVSRSEYSKLFGQIGITQGPGDGSTTFNLPNETSSISGGYKLVRIK